MASPLFQIDDQTDEDFFDKLIEDEEEVGVGFAQSGAEAVSGNVSVEGQAFADKKISEVSQTGIDSGLKVDVGLKNDGYNGLAAGVSGVKVLTGDLAEENWHSSDSKSLDQGSEVRSNDVNVVRDSLVYNTVAESNSIEKRGEGGIVDAVHEGSVSPGAQIREVDWSAFSSESRVENHVGFGSYSDFFSGMEAAGGDPFANLDNGSSDAYVNSVEGIGENSIPGSSLVQQHSGETYETDVSQNIDGQNVVSEYWENLYPGWRFDHNTGLWQQLDNYDANVNTNDNPSSQNISDVTSLSDTQIGSAQVSNYDHLQDSLQSAPGTFEEANSNSSVYDLNRSPQGEVTYPENMVFDPQYPGWYYDTLVGEWRTLESYSMSVNQSVKLDHNQHDHPSHITAGGELPVNNSINYGADSQNQDFDYDTLAHFPDQIVARTNAAKMHDGPNTQIWQPELVANAESNSSTLRNQNIQRYGFEGYSENMSHQFVANEGHSENIFHQSAVQPTNVWSSAGRPYHPIVAFGFGGKLVLMKTDNHLRTIDTYGAQNTVGRVIGMLNLTDIVMDTAQGPSTGMDTSDYFAALCQQSFPGPLVGGSVGMKDVNKWIDERIMNYENSYFKEDKAMKLLFALLKVACQHYGKLRSPFGIDYPLLEKESPELAVADLFASLRRNSQAINRLIQNWPSEGQVQATAYEVQNLLVSGRKTEALECAKQGQLWGPALVLAGQLGDQFYSETVREMALQQLVAGSPLRTLYLLVAGKPNDAFSNSTHSMPVPGVPNGMQPSAQFGSKLLLDDWEENLSVIVANRTKDDEFAIIHLGDCLWKERSEAIGAHVCYLVAEANFEAYSDAARLCLLGADHIRCPRTYAHPEAIQRTELFEYSKVLGNSQFSLLPFQPYKLIYAHMLAEVGKLPESLRYCQAISKTLKPGRGHEDDLFKQLVSSLEERIRTHQQGGYGTNLAPAKLVGKLLNVWSNARGSAGQPPPVVPSPPNSTFQSTDLVTPFSHVPQFSGGLPPLVPLPSSDKFQHKENVPSSNPYRVSNSQSTLTMLSLIPSTSSESLGELTNGANNLVIPNRSISEPDLGKTPSEEPKPQEAQLKTVVSSNPSRFGRFGSQIFQKTVGLVLRPRSGKQAKLGEKNKFYYDEKLKRWVEEGAEPPVEEVALPPPPTTASFLNKIPDNNEVSATNENLHLNNGPAETLADKSQGMTPPIPSGSHQFSSHGRIGVRSRYVDTFNKAGGSSSSLFKPPPISTVTSAVSPNPKFFTPPATVPLEESVPKTADDDLDPDAPNEAPAIAFSEDTVSRSPESGLGTGSTYGTPSTSSNGSSFSSPPPTLVCPSSVPMQRFPSMDNITHRKGESNSGNDSSKHDA
uniref:Protein transport protein sec16 n=1 Tax=Kalanchoe fedtschenkoi TaxID=63787 RepID=A0A7N0UYY4_KALFE